MISNLVFLSLLCSGSVFAAAWKGRKFEEILPITAFGMVLLVFLFGIVGHLYAGVVACAVISIALWLLAIAHVIWKKDVKQTATVLLTPGAVVFVIMFFCLSFWNFNKLAGIWDEFSHWIDVVKAMTMIDDFGTNPNANVVFPSYPPAMSIFQYILQKIYLWFHSEFVFSEWRVYLAYQTLCFIPMFPLLKNCSFKKSFELILYCVMIFLAPLVFYYDLYTSTYIDAFLGILSGAGFAMILLWDQKDILYSVNIWMLCAVLTISKDVGLILSTFLAIAYGVDMILRSEQSEGKNQKRLINIAVSAFAVLLPKLLWEIELKASNAKIVFSNKIDLKQLLLVLLGKDNSYRSEVWKKYCYGLFELPTEIGQVTTNYFALCVLWMTCFYLLYRLYEKKFPEHRKATRFVLMIGAVQELLYIFGMGVVFMFKFLDFLALQLASMERYLNIVFLSGWLVIVAMSIFAVTQQIRNQTYKVVLLSFLLIFTPFKGMLNFVNGTAVEDSFYTRSEYEPIRQWAEENCSGNQKIWIVSQDDTGFDWYVTHFNIRPNMVNPVETWCIGYSEECKDRYTYKGTPEQWKKELDESYDYVFIYDLNEYFMENCADFFEDPSDIAENSLYSVDKETGLLVRNHEFENYIK